MAEWVSHLIIADGVLKQLPQLSKHEYCVGSIAPDCNIPNEDWSEYSPSRKVTHWMEDEQHKRIQDCDRFYNDYIIARLDEIASKEELSFLLGYYSHLVADVKLQQMASDEIRTAEMWKRIRSIPELNEKSKGMEETWDSYTKLFPDRNDRRRDFFVFEKEYLDRNPSSGYITEIRNLKAFPDYIDYFPKGAIMEKVKLMYYEPIIDNSKYLFIGFSREEYQGFIERSIQYIVNAIEEIVCERM